MNNRIVALGFDEKSKNELYNILDKYEIIFVNSLDEAVLNVKKIDLIIIDSTINNVTESIEYFKRYHSNVAQVLILDDFTNCANLEPKCVLAKRPFDKDILNHIVKRSIVNQESFNMIYDELMNQNEKRFTEALNYKPNRIATLRFNLTDNVVLETSNLFHQEEVHNSNKIEDLISLVAKYIKNDSEREHFKNTFSRENAIKEYNKGNNYMQTEFEYFRGNDVINVTINVNTYKDLIDNTIHALVCMYDLTEAKLLNMSSKKLVENKYDTIGVINVERASCKFLFVRNERSNIHEKYDESMKFVSNLIGIEDQKKKFLEKSSLDVICKELKKNDSYFFTIKEKDESGDYSFYQYEYEYLDKNKNLILAIKQDVTLKIEQDLLTTKLNRQGFLHQASKLLKNCEKDEYSILYFNIRKFKAINELFGIDFGNEVLRAFAERLMESSIKPIHLSRIESDQFACIAKTNSLDFDELEERMNFIFTRNNKSIKVSSRLGVYIVAEDISIEQMLDRAKLAKKFIKDETVKSYEIFDDTMKDSYIFTAMSQFNVDRAIENEELKVYYQPVVDCKTGLITSSEALIRWEHPKFGLVSPNSFIPALEESGDISRVDLYVIEQIKKLHKKRKSEKKRFVPVSSNLSRMDLYDEDMMKNVIKTIKEIKSKNEIIRLEITETICVNIEGRAKTLLNEIRKLGTQMYIDDFGSGYSSLSTISDFDFDYLKLDMSFIQNIGNNIKVNSVIKSVIDLAHSLNLKVVAEGVETVMQYKFLKDNDCDFVQGYFFSKPLKSDEYERILDLEGPLLS